MTSYYNAANTGVGPADNAIAVLPDDDSDILFNDVAIVPRAIFVGGEGNLAVITRGGQTVTFYGMRAGDTVPVRVRRILEASTVTNIVVLW